MRGVFGLAIVLGGGLFLWYALSPDSFKAAVSQVRGKTTSAAAGATRNGG